MPSQQWQIGAVGDVLANFAPDFLTRHPGIALDVEGQNAEGDDECVLGNVEGGPGNLETAQVPVGEHRPDGSEALAQVGDQQRNARLHGVVVRDM